MQNPIQSNTHTMPEIFELTNESDIDTISSIDESKHELLPNTTLRNVSANTMSFASLPSDGSLLHKPNGQQSDFLDSLQILCIPLSEEVALIREYFPDIVITDSNTDSDLDSSLNSEMSKTIEFIMNTNGWVYNSETQRENRLSTVDLVLKCGDRYPKQEHSCQCLSLNCQLLTASEHDIFLKNMNSIATQQTRDGHNCVISVLVFIENKLNVLQYNRANNLNEYDLNRVLTEKSSQTSSRTSLQSLSHGNGLNMNGNYNIENGGFFDSLNSLHYKSEKSELNNKILPSSFTALQDIQTTKTRDEKALECKYANIDNQILAPQMCGVVWGKNGELIYFNNILNPKKNRKNSSKFHNGELVKIRDEMKTFRDYNRYIEKCGGTHVHSEELHCVRQKVFANHFDEDEDRFADEFIVGFSLSNNHVLIKNNKRNSYNDIHYRYKNAYLHHSVSFMHNQCHIQGNDHNTYVINNHTNIQNKTKRKRHNKMNNLKSVSLSGQRREGNARLWCAGVLMWPKYGFIHCTYYSKELVRKHRLSVNDNECMNVGLLCEYNSNLCQTLGLERFAQKLEMLSQFLVDCKNGKLLPVLPSAYFTDYVWKFIQKMIDDFYYLDCDIQAIAIVACLLRQSQFCEMMEENQNNHNNFAYFLRCCVKQYLKIITYAISEEHICGLRELQNF